MARSSAWMDGALKDSIGQALDSGWILDCDTSVKLLYGHQAGAQIGYNPVKPGRPSHTIHTYWLANLRLVLDAEVQGGKSTAAKYSMPRLITILAGLPPQQRPSMVRGDNAFGNEPVMSALEAMEQPYLFKLRQTPGVRKLIERNWSRKGLDTVIATAPQLAKPQRWAALVRYIVAQIMAAAPKIYRRSSKILTIPPPLIAAY